MSRAWDKAKQGAALVGKIGAVIGAVAGVAAGIMATAGAAPLVIAAAAIGGALGGAAIGFLQGAFDGALIGGVYGALSDEPKTKTIVVHENAPAKVRGTTLYESGVEQGAPSTTFRTMVNNERAQVLEAQR